MKGAYVVVIDGGTDHETVQSEHATWDAAAAAARRRITRFGEKADVMKVTADGSLTTDF